MRGLSDARAVGHWSEPETITLPVVPHPENISASVNNVKRDNELRVSVEVFLSWKIPQVILDKAQRRRRQTAPGGAPTGYEVLIATKENVGQDYDKTPTGVGRFDMTFNVSARTNAMKS